MRLSRQKIQGIEFRSFFAKSPLRRFVLVWAIAAACVIFSGLFFYAGRKAGFVRESKGRPKAPTASGITEISIPGTGWSLVAKTDGDSAPGPAGTAGLLLLILTLALLAGAAGRLFALARRGEAELASSESKFRLFFEHSALGRSITGLDGTMRVNSAFCSILGYSGRELLQKTWRDITHPDDIEKSDAIARSLLDGTRSSAQFEKRYIHKNGGVIWAEVSTALQRNAAGNPECFITTIDDITAKRLAEERLRETALYLQNLLDYANAPIIVWDPGMRITRFNRAFERLTGRSAEEVIGRQLEILFPGDSRDASLKLIGDALNGEHWETVQIPIIRKDGAFRTVLWNSAAIYRPDGKTLDAVIAQGQDITEMARLNAKLEEKNQEMENFLHVATHDLRSPLVNILGFNRNLERYISELRAVLAPAPIPPEAGRTLEKLTGESIPGALKMVQESSRKMDALITALIEVSRLGRLELNTVRIDMDKFMPDLLATMAFQIKEADAEVRTGPLPQCLGDRAQLSQVFSNLIGNSLKYRAPDRKPVIEISGRTLDDGMVEYRVADNGIGITEEEAAGRIWTLFYRAAAGGSVKGEGIGLTTAKRIIVRHGGKIRAARAPGGGAEFTVQLCSGRRE